MAALRTLITGELAPVGQQVCWREPRSNAYSSGDKRLDGPRDEGTARMEGRERRPEIRHVSSHGGRYRTTWTNSGTAALALAIGVARFRRPEVQRPEVLLPAYGCPGLIAAALYAGVRPVLVDVGADDPAMSSRSLTACWSPSVVAVVAVNFLGIRERIDALQAMAAEKGALLIEDCAQWYPEQPLDADAVVLSFGRGKPVSLLGGGALLLRDEHEFPQQLALMPDNDEVLPFSLKAMLFNAALGRHAYAFARRLPGLAIGETRFRALTAVGAMDEERRRLLAVNIGRWLERERWREHRLDRALAEVDGVDPLPVSLAHRTGRLLRYPILVANRGLRDQLMRTLEIRGMGATTLYGTPLPQVRDVPEEIAEQRVSSETESFAERLITLPLHDGVRASDLARMVRILKRGLKRAVRSAPVTEAI
jgi:dTDP-4-amino-4,6-dideoxygalactose transaminase